MRDFGERERESRSVFVIRWQAGREGSEMDTESEFLWDAVCIN